MEGYSHADILAALQRQSAAPPPPAKQYKDLDQKDLHDGPAKVNTRKLYCPREGCRAVIVQPGMCELIEGKPDVVSILLLPPSLGLVLGMEGTRPSDSALSYNSERLADSSSRVKTDRPSSPPRAVTGSCVADPWRSTISDTRAPRPNPCTPTRPATATARSTSSSFALNATSARLDGRTMPREARARATSLLTG